jgi:hypothetical protein
MDAQNSDVVFPDSPSGAAALAPKKPATVTPKPTPQPATPPEPKPVDNSQDVIALGKEQAAAHEKTARAMGQFNAESMQLKPPELIKPEKFEPKKESPIQEWARAAIVFAALGGHGSRQALTASLNAAAAGLKGMKEGDNEEVERQFKVWQRETENANRLVQFQQDAYKTALGKLANNAKAAEVAGSEEVAAANAKMSALAIAQGDEPMAQAKTAQEKRDLWEKREAYKQTMEERKIEASKGGQMMIARQQVMATPEYQEAKARGDTTTMNNMVADAIHAIDPKEFKSRVPPLDPGVAELQASQIARYERAPYADRVTEYGGPTYQKVAQRVIELNPNYKPIMYPIVQNVLKDATTGKTAQSLQSLAALKQHLTLFEGAIDKLPNDYDVTTLNGLSAKIGKQFGLPGVTNFETYRNFIGSEAGKAMLGVGAGTGHERDAIREGFATGLTKDQLHQGVAVLKNLVGGQADAIDRKISVLPPEFKDIVFSDDVRQFYHSGATESGAMPGESKERGPKARAGSSKENPIALSARSKLEDVKSGDWIKVWQEGSGWVARQKQ